MSQAGVSPADPCTNIRVRGTPPRVREATSAAAATYTLFASENAYLIQFHHLQSGHRGEEMGEATAPVCWLPMYWPIVIPT